VSGPEFPHLEGMLPTPGQDLGAWLVPTGFDRLSGRGYKPGSQNALETSNQFGLVLVRTFGARHLDGRMKGGESSQIRRFSCRGPKTVAKGIDMKSTRLLGVTTVLGLIMAASAIPASAAPYPVTYLNANFGPIDGSGFNFYRSSGTINLSSPSASVRARARGYEVEFSASADNDPNETSSAFSSYDIGTVNAGPGSLNVVTVTPRTLLLSGSASFAMNLWFDSDDDGEYFVWDRNRLAGLGGDVYAIGTSGNGALTIDSTTPLFIIAAGGTPGCNAVDYVATLALINTGFCTKIPPFTNVARWVGIDIPPNTTGSGSATV
jgi:hypothetical protein